MEIGVVPLKHCASLGPTFRVINHWLHTVILLKNCIFSQKVAFFYCTKMYTDERILHDYVCSPQLDDTTNYIGYYAVLSTNVQKRSLMNIYEQLGFKYYPTNSLSTSKPTQGRDVEVRQMTTTTTQDVTQACEALGLGTPIKAEYFGTDGPMNAEYFGVIAHTHDDIRGAYVVGLVWHFVGTDRFCYGNRTYYDERASMKELVAQFHALIAEQLNTYGWEDVQ